MRARPPPAVTVIAPGLFGPRVLRTSATPAAGLNALVAGLDLRATERALARAEALRAPSGEGLLVPALFAGFGVGSPAQADLPVAAVTRVADEGRARAGWHLRADPVHLRAGANEVTMASADDLGLDMAQARSLAEELNAALAPSLHVEPLRAGRWYVHRGEGPRLQTRSPESLLAGRVGGCLPAGEGVREWLRLLTDVQTILHASPVNAARERRGAAAVNSLWFWGAGTTPVVAPGRFDGVWADDVLALGLSRLSGTEAQALPGGFDAWRAGAGAGGEHLLVLEDSAGRRECESDPMNWRSWFEHVLGAWLDPLWEGLARGAVASVRLYPGTARGFRLARATRGRRWRRRREFSAWLDAAPEVGP